MNKACYIAFLLSAVLFLPSCQKNTISKIPQIGLMEFTPGPIKVNIDTFFIKFSIVDGDGDIGNDNASQIWLKDSRFDSAGFQPTPFPPIVPNPEDPAKGLQGTCTFYPIPQPVPRSDSIHQTLNGDTLYYEVYITDRAGHESNHITTRTFIVKP